MGTVRPELLNPQLQQIGMQGQSACGHRCSSLKTLTEVRMDGTEHCKAADFRVASVIQRAEVQSPWGIKGGVLG